jgi:hypothetical protein
MRSAGHEQDQEWTENPLTSFAGSTARTDAPHLGHGAPMKCPECNTGILSRNKKPDALNRTIEKCDSCDYRRVVGAPDIVPALSGSLARPTGPSLHVAPVAVVGQPCPCCHRKVNKLPICVKCKKNRRVLGKSKCEECSRPVGPAPRFCVKCGEKFTPEKGIGGTAAYRCPAHRTKRKGARRAA